jgi:hypothetical protein
MKAVEVPVARLRQHALDLANTFGVVLIEEKRMRPDDAAAVDMGPLRLVFVAPIIDETTYAVALHELGHLIDPMGMPQKRAALNGNADNLLRDCENAAWQWARYQALVWSDAMEHVAQWAEGTYNRPSAPPVPTIKTPSVSMSTTPEIDWKRWK